MKKYFRVFMCLAIVFLLVGCGTTSNGSNGQNNLNTSEQKIQEFVEENKSSVESLSNSLLDVKFVARGKSVVYEYYYKTTYSAEQTSIMKTSIDKSINNSSSAFTNLLSELKTVVPDTESVIVEYYNGDNTLITAIEFK